MFKAFGVHPNTSNLAANGLTWKALSGCDSRPRLNTKNDCVIKAQVNLCEFGEHPSGQSRAKLN